MKLKPAITRTFNLETDPDKEAKVTVRQATTQDAIARNDLFSKTRRIFSDEEGGESIIEQDFNPRQIRSFEAYLTLCDVIGIFGVDGEPLFRSLPTVDGNRVSQAMSLDGFNRAWGLLPIEVTDEIVRCVLAVNREWDPNASQE